MNTENNFISLSQIIDDAVIEGDMEVSETDIIAVLDRCIATINGYLSTEFPKIDETEWLTLFSTTDGYKYIVSDNVSVNDYLLKNVFYPYVVADFKRQAEQINSYSIMYNSFNDALVNFKSRYLSSLKKEYQPKINETDTYAEEDSSFEQTSSFFKRQI